MNYSTYPTPPTQIGLTLLSFMLHVPVACLRASVVVAGTEDWSSSNRRGRAWNPMSNKR